MRAPGGHPHLTDPDLELDFADDFSEAIERVEDVRLPSDSLVDRFAITRTEYLQAMKGDT